MTEKEVQKLPHGVYRIHWKEDGRLTVGAVGSKYNGDRWLCCSNWTSPMDRGTDCASSETWEAVASAELITRC